MASPSRRTFWFDLLLISLALACAGSFAYLFYTRGQDIANLERLTQNTCESRIITLDAIKVLVDERQPGRSVMLQQRLVRDENTFRAIIQKAGCIDP